MPMSLLHWKTESVVADQLAVNGGLAPNFIGVITE